jgi:hypothetical protein
MHTVKEVDMLATKIDLLLKRLNERAHEKKAIKSTIQAMDSHMRCEVGEKLDTQGMTTPRPMKKHRTPTMGSDKVTIRVEQSIPPTRR